jgi:hypothetical protein
LIQHDENRTRDRRQPGVGPGDRSAAGQEGRLQGHRRRA